MLLFTTPWTLALVATLALAGAQAQAQAIARDTDALRRMQRNLQQAMQDRDAAQAEKAAAEREKTAELQAADAQLATVQREMQAQRTSADQFRSQVNELQQQLRQSREAVAAAEQRLDDASADSARDRAELQQALQGRTQTNQALVAQLTAAKAAMDDARTRNVRLHALGLELLDLYRQADGDARWLKSEPVLGLGAVRVEELAEQARLKLDAAALKKAE